MSQKKVKQYRRLTTRLIKNERMEFVRQFLDNITEWPLKDRIKMAVDIILKRGSRVDQIKNPRRGWGFQDGAAKVKKLARG